MPLREQATDLRDLGVTGLDGHLPQSDASPRLSLTWLRSVKVTPCRSSLEDSQAAPNYVKAFKQFLFRNSVFKYRGE
jgi:hypothetical protein